MRCRMAAVAVCAVAMMAALGGGEVLGDQIRFSLPELGVSDAGPFSAEAPFPLFDPVQGKLVRVTLEGNFLGSMTVFSPVERDVSAMARFECSLEPTPGSLERLELSVLATASGHAGLASSEFEAFLTLSGSGSQSISIPNVSDYIGTSQGVARLPLAFQTSTDSGTVAWGERGQLTVVYDYAPMVPAPSVAGAVTALLVGAGMMRWRR